MSSLLAQGQRALGVYSRLLGFISQDQFLRDCFLPSPQLQFGFKPAGEQKDTWLGGHESTPAYTIQDDPFGFAFLNC